MPLFVKDGAVDPALASLFSASVSSGPVVPSKILPSSLSEALEKRKELRGNGQVDPPAQSRSADDFVSSLSSVSEQSSKFSTSDDAVELSSETGDEANPTYEPPSRKRKHKDMSDEVEASYLRRLAREESREEQRSRPEHFKKRPKPGNSDSGSSAGVQSELDSDIEEQSIPQHESLVGTSHKAEAERSTRTVFLGNVSTKAIKSKSAKKTLLAHLSSFLPKLGTNNPPHKIESIRFRSTAFSTTAVPKKGAFAKKELMDATTQSTNAYAVYSTDLAARKAALLLNGTVVLDRHLRIDSAANPAPTDHRRCVFVGNLNFVDEEPANTEEGSGDVSKKKKAKLPADAEEGLWRTFSKCGPVESVRVIRDKSTRVGKGFAYVQFKDENGVEEALSFNEKKFPPLLPRKLRVVRAKSMKKRESDARKTATTPLRQSRGTHLPTQSQAFQGRASGLAGKPKAAIGIQAKTTVIENRKAFQKPGSFVFEGYRATSKGAKGVGPTKRKRSGGKPKTRSSRRGAAFKAAGGKRKRDA